MAVGSSGVDNAAGNGGNKASNGASNGGTVAPEALVEPTTQPPTSTPVGREVASAEDEARGNISLKKSRAPAVIWPPQRVWS